MQLLVESVTLFLFRDVMSNPNNCETCGHKARPEGGHCYMFRHEPEDVCMVHTARRDLYDVEKAMKRIVARPTLQAFDKEFSDLLFGEK